MLNIYTVNFRTYPKIYNISPSFMDLPSPALGAVWVVGSTAPPLGLWLPGIHCCTQPRQRVPKQHVTYNIRLHTASTTCSKAACNIQHSSTHTLVNGKKIMTTLSHLDSSYMNKFNSCVRYNHIGYTKLRILTFYQKIIFPNKIMKIFDQKIPPYPILVYCIQVFRVVCSEALVFALMSWTAGCVLTWQSVTNRSVVVNKKVAQRVPVSGPVESPDHNSPATEIVTVDTCPSIRGEKIQREHKKCSREINWITSKRPHESYFTQL